MTAIRPLDREDLPALAALYADLVGWKGEAPGFERFFARTLLEQPFADPEVPSLVYDDPHDGVVGVMGSNLRPYSNGERSLRIASGGPLIVKPEHRRRGVGALLLGSYASGPQDMTINDRVVDNVRSMWGRLGGVTDAATSIGWALALAPAGIIGGSVARRAMGRGKLPGAALLSKLDAPTVRRLKRPPPSGVAEPLTNGALLDLLPRLQRQFPLRPAYDDAYLSWLFSTMETVNVGERLVRRLVRADGGRPAGAYVMYVSVHGRAQVMQIAAAGDDTGLVLDHLVHEAASEGAVEVRGRVEPALLPHLYARRWCRFVPSDWVVIHGSDPTLIGTVLSGRALITRLEGEWWMRPWPTAR